MTSKLSRWTLSKVLAGVLVAALALAGIYTLNPRLLHGTQSVDPVSSERLNNISVLVPKGEPEGLVILLSGADGMGEREQAMTTRLLADDLIVLPVDLEVWRKELNKEEGDCMYVGADFEGIAKEAQRVLQSNKYFHPVVLGMGEGGTLAYAALADAPDATLGGAVALDPTAAVNTVAPVCEGAKVTKDSTGQGYSYALSASLPDPGVLVQQNPETIAAPVLEPGHVALTVKTAPTPEARFDLAAQTALDLARADARSQALPIVTLPAKGKPRFLALFYSGDGGWRDIDKSLGDALANDGVQVVGVDSLRYFWSVRTPEEIARDAAAIIRSADPSGKLPVALLGYSFGANTVPFAWPYLPPHVQNRIRFFGLLGTETTTPFQVSVENWLGLGGDNKVAPAIAALPQDRVLCIYGSEEDETACKDPALAGTEKLELEGGHHFDGDYLPLAAKILASMEKRIGGVSP